MTGTLMALLGFTIFCVVLCLLAITLEPFVSDSGRRLRLTVLEAVKQALDRDPSFKLSSDAQRTLSRLTEACSEPVPPGSDNDSELLTALTGSAAFAAAAFQRSAGRTAQAVGRLSHRFSADHDADMILRKSDWWITGEQTRLLYFAIRDSGFQMLANLMKTTGRLLAVLTPALAVSFTVVWALLWSADLARISYLKVVELAGFAALLAATVAGSVTLFERTLRATQQTDRSLRVMRLLLYGSILFGAAAMVAVPAWMDLASRGWQWVDQQIAGHVGRTAGLAVGYTLFLSFLWLLTLGGTRGWRNRALPLWERFQYLSQALLIGAMALFATVLLGASLVWRQPPDRAMRALATFCFVTMLSAIGVGFWSWRARRRSSGWN